MKSSILPVCYNAPRESDQNSENGSRIDAYVLYLAWIERGEGGLL